jgi:endonuclease III
MKISGSEIKQVDRFTYTGGVAEKNSEIQNEVNKRIRKATQFYHLIKSILWNKDVDRKLKPQCTRCTLRRYYYME